VTWPIIFMLVVLKIPIIYLCAVVWWAIKAERRPEAPAALVPAWDPELGGGPRRHRGRRVSPRPPRGPQRRPGPRSAPARMYARR
jgi:hypothetical protein